MVRKVKGKRALWSIMDFMAQVRLHDGSDDPSFMMCWMHKEIRYLISLCLDILLRYIMGWMTQVM